MEEVNKNIQDPATPSVPSMPEKTQIIELNALKVKEEHLHEYLDTEGRGFSARIIIFRRDLDEQYCGRLYVDKIPSASPDNKPFCEFVLGRDSSYVERYLKQFQKILTEKGKKLVKITSKIGDESPVVKYSRPVNESMAATVAALSAVTAQQQATASTSNAPQIAVKQVLAPVSAPQAQTSQAQVSGQNAPQQIQVRPQVSGVVAPVSGKNIPILQQPIVISSPAISAPNSQPITVSGNKRQRIQVSSVSTEPSTNGAIRIVASDAPGITFCCFFRSP